MNLPVAPAAAALRGRVLQCDSTMALHAPPRTVKLAIDFLPRPLLGGLVGSFPHGIPALAHSGPRAQHISSHQRSIPVTAAER